MSSIQMLQPIHVGLIADEPIRLEGLASVFEEEAGKDHVRMLPVIGTIEELLQDAALEYMVVDLNSSSSSGGMKTLEFIRRQRPALRLIVIGPEGDDELVIESILASSGQRQQFDQRSAPPDCPRARGAGPDSDGALQSGNRPPVGDRRAHGEGSCGPPDAQGRRRQSH